MAAGGKAKGAAKGGKSKVRGAGIARKGVRPAKDEVVMRRYYKSGGKICPKGKAWAKRTFDTYPSAYANMAASKYCKDPNYAKGSKGKKKKKK
jgi:hypothetical protein